ncbi:MAG: hypothetical protein H3C32_08605 [Anaerolineae bacterium]|nr:MAG: hypothetical protein UZ13_00266 [Chloroflexi bacterium OLB13]MBW7879360.1 hypothetical protein [Anaerolineae bacterium]
MATNNVNAMVKDAVRALKANDRATALELLQRATETDPYNEQAWLWLSGVVETEDDQRTCLQNVMFINPGNENARQGLEMLDAKLAARPKTEPKPSNPNAFAGFDLPSGDDWLAELDEMRQSAISTSSTNPFNVSLDEFDDVMGDAFADPFGDSYIDPANAPFSASTPDLPVVAPMPTTTARPSSPLEEDLETLFGGVEMPQSPEEGKKPKAKPAKPQKPDPLAHIPDDADAATLFNAIPRKIRIGSLPGAPRKAPVLLRLILAGLVLANVILSALIFIKVTA